MNDDFPSSRGGPELPLTEARPVTACQPAPGFFQSVDWLSFGLTTGIVFAIYLFTLAPDVTLEYQGIFTTGAFYAGVPHPPGYPLWTLYAWLFTELLPVSNLAWRVAVSSAVAGALTCGLLALMVSRVGKSLLESIPGLTTLSQKQENWLRVIAGYAAAMAFGFSDPLWFLAVVGNVWPLSMLLLTGVICLLLRWFHDPARRRYLVAACFVYGLTLTNSQALTPAAPGLAMMVVLGSAATGRDGLFSVALLLAVSVTAHFLGFLPWVLEAVAQTEQFGSYYVRGGIITFLFPIVLVLKTRRLFTEWKTMLASGTALVLGLSLYLYLPIASMTNPPVNWGYPRTVSGFVHDITRGQFERIHPVETPGRFAEAMGTYSRVLLTCFGWIYIVPAVVPFLMFHKMRGQFRRLMIGTLAIFASLSLLVVYFLNPPPDRSSLSLDSGYFSPSYLVLALWAGWGIILAGGVLGRPGEEKGRGRIGVVE